MRPDLAALTPETLAALTNLGLVKRAQRELAAGVGPALTEDAAGTVTGTFPDGAVARLPRSTPLDRAPCTCGAPRACRHRVAVALAYAPWLVAQATPAPPRDRAAALTADAGAGAAPAADSRVPADAAAAPAAEAWSPADIGDAELETALGARLYAAACAARDRGLLATVESLGVPTARLPTCTVRFLVPRDVAYAKCDCADAGGRCAHLALAVWAFRAARSGVVQLGGAAAPAASRDASLDEALALAHAVLDGGVATAPPPGTRFARVRAALDGARLTWLHALVCDLEIALDGYAKRSARFGTREIAALVTELAARVRAGRRDGPELPARFVLGADQARETLLDHLRLISLGARVTHDERARFADVYLADPDTATVLVLRKRWDFPDTTPEEGPDLARRAIAPRLTLGGLAAGALVSKAVRRGASRAITLATGGAVRSALTPQTGDFSSLPAPLLVRDLRLHAEAVARRPPRLLRPRVLAEEVHAIAVGAVHRVIYDEAEQTLVAALADAAGRPFTLALCYRRSAPHALPALAAALAGPVRFVTGDLRHGAGGWTLEPLAVTADRLVVPDLAGPAPDAGVPRGVRPPVVDPVDAALGRAEAALQELCHAGTAAPPRAAIERARAAVIALEEAGLGDVARRLRALTAAPGAAAWLDAAIRLALVREAASLVPSSARPART